MSKFSDNFIAVGTTFTQEDKAQGVVLVISGIGNVTLGEHAARKLADDLLRNANFMWPIEEESKE